MKCKKILFLFGAMLLSSSLSVYGLQIGINNLTKTRHGLSQSGVVISGISCNGFNYFNQTVSPSTHKAFTLYNMAPSGGEVSCSLQSTTFPGRTLSDTFYISIAKNGNCLGEPTNIQSYKYLFADGNVFSINNVCYLSITLKNKT